MSESKREVPPALQKVLKYDGYITNQFVTWTRKYLPSNQLKVQYKALEISCHGIPWLAFWIAFSWLFNNPHLVEMQVNMLLGLFIDIIVIAITKAYVRRRRPVANVDDMMGQMGPDVFSFPSGHASRAMFVVYFFLRLWPVHFIFHMPLISWALGVGISRILLNRHYIGDVLCGFLLGLVEGLLMELLWVEDSTARWLFNVVSDEKMDGGEYHV